jgi:glycosyltransferase involved in cell wall biosynthesis
MSVNNKVIVTVSNDLYTDQRVHKVCSFIEKQGYDVLLVGRIKKESKEIKRSYATHRLKLWFSKGPLFYAEFNLRLFFYLLVHKSSKIVANDLDTLLACYSASKFKLDTQLIYDTHEYFTEVPELVARPKVKKIWEGIEGWIFPKLKAIYTVNESIAQLYSTKYKKEINVVRNISPLYQPSALKTKEELGIPTNKFVIIIQGAGINIDRGAEETVSAMQLIEDSVLLIVGDGDVVPQLKENVKKLQLDDKVKFFPKMSYHKMMNYTYHADLGLTLDKPTNINYRFSLPNKIFDYIHANIPVLGTDLVEIKNIIETYEVGRIIPELTSLNLAQTINEIKVDKLSLENWKTNCTKAKEVLNWEKESETLKQFYPKIAN